MPENTPVSPRSRLAWRDAWRVYLEPASIRMLLLGFSAGLPLLLVFGTLSFWLREAGINRTTIGHLSWVGLAYGFKWVWSPLVDRMPIPVLTHLMGRRRSWLLLSQLAIIAALVGMAMTDPQAGANPHGVGCADGGICLRHPGHRAGRLPDRVGQTWSARPHWPRLTRPVTGSP
jgi:PAT family beta-lactamase induction signal transducer AmpG